MEISELIKLEDRKKQLVATRQKLIAKELKRRQKEKVNLDQSSLKSGHIEKSKVIRKKEFQEIKEKGRKIKVELQQNVNVNTFITHNSNYQRIFARTKLKINIAQDGDNALKALAAFGITHHNNNITITLHFKQAIVCHPTPFIIQLPYPQKPKKTIAILKNIKSEESPIHKLVSPNLLILSSGQFIQKYKQDRQFAKNIGNQSYKCLVDFQVYKRHEFYKKLLNKNVIIFPIDTKKVPYSLQETHSFDQYLQMMSNLHFAIAKSGTQQY